MMSRVLPFALTSVVFLIGGCSSEQSPSPDPSPATSFSAAPAPQQPFDILRGEELALIDATQFAARNQCMADSGYPQFVEQYSSWRPPDLFQTLKVSAATYGPTSEDEARRLGFGFDSPGEPARIDANDASFDSNLQRCTEEAWTSLGPDARQVYYDAYDLYNLLAPFKAEYRAPDSLRSSMYDCMVAKGYNSDRDAFLQLPSYRNFGVTFGGLEPAPELSWTAQHRPGTVEVGPAIPPRRYTPTPAEADLAVAWYQCDQQVGWVAALMAGDFASQQRYLDRYETRIAELNDRLAAIARNLATQSQTS